MPRDDSHPTSDQAPQGEYLIPELYEAAKLIGMHTPCELLRLAERECGLMPHSLKRLGLISGDEQLKVLERLREMRAEQRTEASDA